MPLGLRNSPEIFRFAMNVSLLPVVWPMEFVRNAAVTYYLLRSCIGHRKRIIALSKHERGILDAK